MNTILGCVETSILLDYVKSQVSEAFSSVGLAKRVCLANDTWGSPNVTECRTVEQIRLEMKADELVNLIDSIFVNEDRDLTQTFMPEVVEDIADELEEITNTTQPLLPNDVSSAANTVNAIIL